MKILFWTLIIFIIYTYLGYPGFLYVLSVMFPKSIKKKYPEIYPLVSVIIAARNEEGNIEKRIKNIANQDYQKDKIEIIIISDGSTDHTDFLVEKNIKEFSPFFEIRLLQHFPSRGKPFSINKGIEAAQGEIVVFTDCRQRFDVDAIKEIVANFSDENVGCVSGELLFEEKSGSDIKAEMGAYWAFEKKIRKMESKTGSVVGATGAIYAIRKRLFCPMPEETLLDDVFIPIKVCKQGYRVIFDSNAIAYDVVSVDFNKEKKRKIRTLAGNWQLLSLNPTLIIPFFSPLFLRFISHKIFRLLVPFALIFLFIVSLYIHDILSIIVLILFILCSILVFIPLKRDNLFLISKLSKTCRALFFLNYFAFLAPFKLMIKPKKLW